MFCALNIITMAVVQPVMLCSGTGSPS